MNEKQIIENNRLIAEFLDWFTEDNPSVKSSVYETPMMVNVSSREDWETKVDYWTSWLRADEMKFHTSWDWLMISVEKIEDLVIKTSTSESLVFSVNITNDFCAIIWNDEDTEHSWAEIEEVAPTKIQATYKAVVELIKWYNTLEK